MFGSQILFMNLGPTEILIIVKNFKEGMNEVTDVTKEEKKDE